MNVDTWNANYCSSTNCLIKFTMLGYLANKIHKVVNLLKLLL